MKATRLKESKKINGGVFYKLDTPIQHEDKTYDTIVTWCAERHRSSILIFPARSGVIGVIARDGKFLPDENILSVDGYVRSEDLISQIGYEIA